MVVVMSVGMAVAMAVSMLVRGVVAPVVVVIMIVVIVTVLIMTVLMMIMSVIIMVVVVVVVRLGHAPMSHRQQVGSMRLEARLAANQAFSAPCGGGETGRPVVDQRRCLCLAGVR